MKSIFLAVFILLYLSSSKAQTSNNQFPLPASFPQLFRSTVSVDTKFFPSDSVWIKRSTFLMQNLKEYKPSKEVINRYGGIVAGGKHKTTGFFYTQKIDGRWWIIDPEGYKWYCKSLVAVTPNSSDRGKKALTTAFGSPENWANKTSEYIKTLGFNSAGAWSKIQDLSLTRENKIVYSVVLDIMSQYGYSTKVAHQGTGHTDFKASVMPVFDPGFQLFADKYVKEKTAQVKNDPWLLGYFSDNELNFANDVLKRILKFPVSDPSYIAAKAWADKNAIDLSNLTKADEDKFLEYYVERYYSIVSSAIRKADPNHLLLTSRLHGPDKNRKVMFKIAGKYSDIISYNYYKSWYPETKVTDMWVEESGRPFMITEWYAKGMDSDMPNETGWGWTVKTQADRGNYYQNFALGLLANKNCVGWQWFKYMDNDPMAKADPSNRDSNKGIVTWDYKLYSDLPNAIKELNVNAYSLINFFDKKL